MNKRSEIVAQTKQNIMDAFWSLYCERRIEKISVRDITNKAGYNRGTFYEYFSDVYDVLEQIENLLIPTLNELPPVSTPIGSFGMPLDAFLDLYKQNRKYYSVLLGENGDPAFASKLKNTVKPVIMNFFETNQEVNKSELDYILEYTLAAMIGLMSYWYQQPEPLATEDLHDLIVRLMEQGVTEQFQPNKS